jgi:hypothetical protein
MAIVDNSTEVAQKQIPILQEKLATMLKNRADFFKRKDQLRNQIAAARAAIVEAKTLLASGNKEAQQAIEQARNDIQGWQNELSKMPEPPNGEGSAQYNALVQRIADLEKQIAADVEQKPYGEDVVFASAVAIASARAARQAASGAEQATIVANNERFAVESAANRLNELDGVK